ncbi:Peptidase A1 [Macleaya cordata]|uniref:Peptidase A1 n=1 Tax=Macleaya cordata TaxID=56857 RepID=A0A200QJW2_MACCD|nr:Peptidase A1 [Macleaya cordata]
MVGALEALLMVVLLHFLALATTTTTAAAAGAGAGATNFQELNVKEVIAGTKIHPSQLGNYQELSKNNDDPAETDEWKWKLNLVHRDVISAGNLSGHGRRFYERIKRDIKRVTSLTRRLTGRAEKTTKNSSSSGGGGGGFEVEDFGSEVVSGMDLGSGEYFVRIGVGSPPRSQYMVIDSGSDIMWVQCQPCNQCYRQADPVFDPSDSATFSGVSCKSTVCDRLDRNSGCHAGKCRYEVSYGDGSYTKGTLAFETLTFGRTVVRNVAIGCGHMNRGMFVGAAGLLGLGGGPMSFIGQLGAQIDSAFGYCLVSRGTGSYGSLVFGRGVVPKGIASWVPLLRNPRVPTFYYVDLVGLGVGATRLPISEDLFKLSEMGDGGVVMDTGTAVTRLPLSAYEMFRDYFIAGTVGLPRASGVAIFDTCYDLFGFEMVRVPTVSFYFSGGSILTLPARNFLIPVDEIGTFCFAFAPSSLGLSIIGNIQQEGIQISFDGANGLVGFGPNTC